MCGSPPQTAPEPAHLRIGLGQALGALARFGAMTGIEPRPLKDAALRGLDAGVALRWQVIDRLTMEKNRLSEVRERRVCTDLKAHIVWLEKRLSGLDHELRQRIKDSPVWRVKDDLLQRIKGIAELTEWGELDRQQIAAWVAPFNHDSGKGKRSIWGGRPVCAMRGI